MNKDFWEKRADIVEARLAHLRSGVKDCTSARRKLAVACLTLAVFVILLIAYVFGLVDLA